jgi:hypothetical protein
MILRSSPIACVFVAGAIAAAYTHYAPHHRGDAVSSKVAAGFSTVSAQKRPTIAARSDRLPLPAAPITQAGTVEQRVPGGSMLIMRISGRSCSTIPTYASAKRQCE